MFQDEARFGRISDHRRCWAPLPIRPVVGHQVVREYIYALTAVSPHDGRLACLIMPWVDAETMSIFLAHTAQTFPDEFCLMILDGAGWHHAGDLRVPENMALIFLPPYSPELNPVEHLWAYLRTHAMGNTAFHSLDQVQNVLASGLRDLDQQPELVHAMTNFNWLNTICLTLN